MNRLIKLAAGTLAMAALPAAATAESTQALNFIGCPVVRQTNDILCWLASYKGELYFLGYQGNLTSVWYPPMLRHKVVIEDAHLAPDGASECGGKKLDTFHSAVDYEIDESCNTVLPAEDRYPTPPNYWNDLQKIAGPGNIRPEGVGFYLHPAQKPVLAPPFARQSFDVLFDNNFPVARPRSAPAVEAAADLAMASGGTVEVIGQRGAARMSDGTVLIEDESVARERAEIVARALETLGVDARQIKLSWRSEPADPAEGWKSRKATLVVSP